jgi:hypothetical protein
VQKIVSNFSQFCYITHYPFWAVVIAVIFSFVYNVLFLLLWPVLLWYRDTFFSCTIRYRSNEMIGVGAGAPSHCRSSMKMMRLRHRDWLCIKCTQFHVKGYTYSASRKFSSMSLWTSSSMCVWKIYKNKSNQIEYIWRTLSL